MFSLFEILGQESLKKMVAQNNRKIIEFLYQNQSFFSYNVESPTLNAYRCVFN